MVKLNEVLRIERSLGERARSKAVDCTIEFLTTGENPVLSPMSNIEIHLMDAPVMTPARPVDFSIYLFYALNIITESSLGRFSRKKRLRRPGPLSHLSLPRVLFEPCTH